MDKNNTPTAIKENELILILFKWDLSTSLTFTKKNIQTRLKLIRFL